MSYNNNWIVNAIKNEHINHYEYKDFYNVREIGSGGFGKVYRANWKNSHILALKSHNDSTAEKFVNELKIQRKVTMHDNIIKFYGIATDDQNYSSNKYLLVMEYADGGTLREYLRQNFGSLTWNNKFKMAYQLADAVLWLHNSDVIHRDLHSNNVLIHRGVIKLADFGLSKKIDESITSQQGGIIPYVDPKKFASSSYSLNKKSDVYSIGVLLWEISSGRPPFSNEYNRFRLPELILRGHRETPIPNTPKDYEKVYTDCWKFEPDDRPDIHEVVTRLGARTTSNITPRHNLSPSNNSSYSSNDDLPQSFRNKGSKSKKDIVDGIATLPYKIYDKNKKQKILDYLSDHHTTPKEIFNWLLNNKRDPNSFYVLGDFNYLGIATEVDKQKAYNFYLDAGDRDDGHSTAQYNLGFMCENDKFGDTLQAIYWYRKSAEQGNHEARERFDRLQRSDQKTVSLSNKYSTEIFDNYNIFNPYE
ncbi:kinase-like domain-containing protein [Rhizophagus clarus]|uniref:Kinase-like domain-containing protein n=1 Tax=Rhizophagus clarus TaxID=94130 RepID=A0A8H3LDL5_9GLOM|nr:kinase-like domain-containing protein [Rhizophagus clarus]